MKMGLRQIRQRNKWQLYYGKQGSGKQAMETQEISDAESETSLGGRLSAQRGRKKGETF